MRALMIGGLLAFVLAVWMDAAAAQSRKSAPGTGNRTVAAPVTADDANANAATEDETDVAADPAIEATVPGGVCKDVAFTIRNRTGAPIKIVSIDHATDRRWTRGPVVFATIDDGADYEWKGAFDAAGGMETRFRINTRTIIDPVTERYGDLASRVIETEACANGGSYVVAVPEGAE